MPYNFKNDIEIYISKDRYIHNSLNTYKIDIYDLNISGTSSVFNSNENYIIGEYNRFINFVHSGIKASTVSLKLYPKYGIINNKVTIQEELLYYGLTGNNTVVNNDVESTIDFNNTEVIPYIYIFLKFNNTIYLLDECLVEKVSYTFEVGNTVISEWVVKTNNILEVYYIPEQYTNCSNLQNIHISNTTNYNIEYYSEDIPNEIKLLTLDPSIQYGDIEEKNNFYSVGNTVPIETDQFGNHYKFYGNGYLEALSYLPITKFSKWYIYSEILFDGVYNATNTIFYSNSVRIDLYSSSNIDYYKLALRSNILNSTRLSKPIHIDTLTTKSVFCIQKTGNYIYVLINNKIYGIFEIFYDYSIDQHLREYIRIGGSFTNTYISGRIYNLKISTNSNLYDLEHLYVINPNEYIETTSNQYLYLKDDINDYSLNDRTLISGTPVYNNDNYAITRSFSIIDNLLYDFSDITNFDEFSFSFYIYPENTFTSGKRTILNLYNDTTNEGIKLDLIVENDKEYTLKEYLNTNASISVTNTMYRNKWNYVTITRKLLDTNTYELEFMVNNSIVSNISYDAPILTNVSSLGLFSYTDSFGYFENVQLTIPTLVDNILSSYIFKTTKPTCKFKIIKLIYTIQNIIKVTTKYDTASGYKNKIYKHNEGIKHKIDLTLYNNKDIIDFLNFNINNYTYRYNLNIKTNKNNPSIQFEFKDCISSIPYINTNDVLTQNLILYPQAIDIKYVNKEIINVSIDTFMSSILSNIDIYVDSGDGGEGDGGEGDGGLEDDGLIG